MERVVPDQGLLLIARTGTIRRSTSRPGKPLVRERIPNSLQDGLRVHRRGRCAGGVRPPVDGEEVVVNVEI